MASTLLAVLAASGLAAAQTPAAPATRAAQALPAVAKAHVAPAGCFAPVQDGKVATIGEIRKNQSSAACAANGQGAVGAAFAPSPIFRPGPFNLLVNTAIAAAVAVPVAIAVQPSNQACFKGNVISGC